MWVRGLKLSTRQALEERNLVAPYVGAWIETTTPIDISDVFSVAPYVGAWIETDSKELAQYQHASRTLCGCVD